MRRVSAYNEPPASAASAHPAAPLPSARTRRSGPMSLGKTMRLGAAFLLLLATLMAAAPAAAQTSMGGVSGTVTDPSGGVVPGATVTLINEGTSVQNVRTTNSSGFYTFVNVRPGRYLV